MLAHRAVKIGVVTLVCVELRGGRRSPPHPTGGPVESFIFSGLNLPAVRRCGNARVRPAQAIVWKQRRPRFERFTRPGKPVYTQGMTGFGGKKLIIGGEEYLLVPAALCAAMPALPSAAALPPGVLAELADGRRSPIAVLREHTGITQKQLAGSLGLTRVAISQFEAGSGASVETLVGMTAVLGVPADLLIQRKGE